MASTGLFGPHALDEKTIDTHVGASTGTYVLGSSDGDTFYVNYVGRSDTDLNGRLKQWVGSYKHFKYGHYTTVKDAFEKECSIFHDFGGTSKLDNDIHPDRPKNKDYECPGCDVFD